MGWTFLKISESQNWIILKKIVFPLKSLLVDSLNIEEKSYDISMHIQRRHDVSCQKGMPINDSMLNINENTVIKKTLERVFEYIIDANYVEYDIYRETKWFCSFRLYIDPNTIRIVVKGKEFKYNELESIEIVKRIKDDILTQIGFRNICLLRKK